MASIQVNALIDTSEMEIILDNNDWASLTVNGEEIARVGDWYKYTAPLNSKKEVTFTAIVNNVEIVNPNVKLCTNGHHYSGYMLNIDYAYINSTQVQLTGLFWQGGFCHESKESSVFSQVHLSGQYSRVSKKPDNDM